MTIAKSEDIRWIASGLDDFAVLLRVHGIDHLADQLDVVQVALSKNRIHSMRTAINTRLVFEIPAKRRPGKQERRGVWLASRVVAALCRCGEPPLVDHDERSTDYRPFGAAAPAAWRASPRSAGPRCGRWPLAMINAPKRL